MDLNREELEELGVFGGKSTMGPFTFAGAENPFGAFSLGQKENRNRHRKSSLMKPEVNLACT